MIQGLIQWGGQRGHGPPSWGKMPQILGQMPSKSGQNAPICTKVSQEFGQNAPHSNPTWDPFGHKFLGLKAELLTLGSTVILGGTQVPLNFTLIF